MTASRIVRTLVLTGSLVAGLTFGFRESVLVGLVVFTLVVPFEKLFRRHDQPIRRPGLRTDLAHVATRPVLGLVGIAVAVVVGVLSLAWLPGLLLRPLVSTLPGWLQLVAGVALFDLAAYETGFAP